MTDTEARKLRKEVAELIRKNAELFFTGPLSVRWDEESLLRAADAILDPNGPINRQNKRASDHECDASHHPDWDEDPHFGKWDGYGNYLGWDPLAEPSGYGDGL